MGDYWPYSHEKNIERIIYIGDYVYTISEGMVQAHTMGTLQYVNELELE